MTSVFQLHQGAEVCVLHFPIGQKEVWIQDRGAAVDSLPEVGIHFNLNVQPSLSKIYQIHLIEFLKLAKLPPAID